MRNIKKQLTIRGTVLFLLAVGIILIILVILPGEVNAGTGTAVNAAGTAGKPANNDDEPGTTPPQENAAAEQNLGKQVYIEAGEYYVGDDRESDNRPLRKQYFKGFYMDVHPVTNGQYAEFLTRSGYQPKGNFAKEKALAEPLLPAANVTYEDAEAYATFYKKRLPTEWEWEIAARSLKQRNSFVSAKTPPQRRGHFLNDKKYYNLPVFTYPPNELGIYDMPGNVFEWTSSQYEEKYLQGKYVQGQRVMVLRGGSWTNRAFEIQTTTRTPFPAQRCLGWVGFRCVSDMK